MGSREIRARRFVIATGSSPLIPLIPGLNSVPYLTNESIFDLDRKPEHLLVIGGGAVGIELAQAYSRLGSSVTIIERFTILGSNDAEAVALIRRRLLAEKIVIYENTTITNVERNGQRISIVAKVDGKTSRVYGSHLLIATGRSPNLNELNLEAASVEYSEKGVTVDARLRTTNKKIFAIGDVASPYKFTHVAGYHASIVIRNALFKLPAKVNYNAVPLVIFTDPEFAQVGMTEAYSRERFGDDLRVLRWPFSDNDRALVEREFDGMIKVIMSSRGRIRGATIVGAHAGELILPWVLATREKQKIHKIAGLIAPYPTLSEIGKRVAGSYLTPTLFGEHIKRLVRLLRNI